MAPKPGFYAVKVGRVPGVYKTWPEAEAQVNGFVGCIHKKFPTRQEAEAFAGGKTAPPAPSTSRPTTRPREEDATAKASSSNKRRKSDQVFHSPASKGRRVFCDGSSRGNGQVGATAGIGVFWSHEPGANNLSERLPGPAQTNNRAEMYAVARILETDPTPELPLTICTDSQYTISVFSDWIPGWRKRNWRTAQGTPVINKDLILYVLSLIALRQSSSSPSSATANITFQKVRAHVGIEGNEMADKLANNGATMFEVKARDFEKDTRANEAKLRKRKGGEDVKIETIDLTYEVEADVELWTEEEMKRMGEKQEF